MDAHPCDDGRWSLGMVLLRSEDGGCVGAVTRIVRGSNNTLEGEALGLQAALDFVASKGFQQVVIEMDAKTIVSVVKRRSYPNAY
jgi:ribonuclease HI